MSIESVVIEAIAKQKQLSLDAISLDSKLQDLGVSSLDAITIVYEVEEAFDVEVPNDALERLDRVKDIVEGVSRLLSKDTAG
ncbi:acyl carrier protein [endosymbiont of Ridgeia piscesae]|jgi:acyl carrier protein|uniref:Acyl carrier protein n=1 Tax=endosymbiont of Ridgeia piscesae TaxID=54398 RepID=A0A0T5YWJ9_9GAMM|nr:phosphopantetheine-binding protein [endosymbiont of Ridgeia piscesae]KRT54925.1 Acyl carrier protein [endosymbiont of Ridgeia piscesae]KRT59656.1 acyl carrier protein [endosymbiont of Ridgeia piscesae]